MISVLHASCPELEAQLPARNDGALSGLEDAVTAEDTAYADLKIATTDKRRALTSRAALRLLLAHRSGMEPLQAADLMIDRQCPLCGSPHGPPRSQAASLSSSRSENAALAGVARTGLRLGVDIERIPDRLFPGFDHYALHPVEAGALDVVPPSSRSTPPAASTDPGTRIRDRIDRWVLKEAVLKAAGLGLDHAPHDLLLGEPRTLTPWKDGTVTHDLSWHPVVEAASARVHGLWACLIPGPAGHAAAVAASVPTEIHQVNIEQVLSPKA